jgi:hypothetical protein
MVAVWAVASTAVTRREDRRDDRQDRREDRRPSRGRGLDWSGVRGLPPARAGVALRPRVMPAMPTARVSLGPDEVPALIHRAHVGYLRFSSRKIGDSAE